MNGPNDYILYGRFPTTHWSIVLDDDTSGAEKSASLEILCKMYWYPLYVYARRKGSSHQEAEDRTQAFLVHLLSNHKITQANPERGHFRTFLLSTFQNFLIDQWRKNQTQKHGGTNIIESIETERAARRFSTDLIDPGCTPSQAYDQTWALQMIAGAKADLRNEYKANGQEESFRIIEPILLEAPGSVRLANQAKKLGMNTHALSTALSRARKRLGKLITARLMDTVQDADQAERELRHLIEACRGLYNLL